MYKIYLAVGLIYTVLLSCHRGASNSFDNERLECGASLHSGPYVKVYDTTGKKISSESLSLTTRDSNGVIRTDVRASEKGCVYLESLAGSSFVLFSSNDANGKKAGLVVNPSSLQGGDLVQLEEVPSTRPAVNCFKRYIQDPQISPEQFISFESVPTKWALFYTVNADISRQSASEGQSLSMMRYERSVPSFINHIWDISELSIGSYSLNLSLFDYTRREALTGMQCPIDTGDYSLVVDLATPIADFRDYFGFRYGVVEQNYSPNFYVIEGLDDMKIEYCIFKVDPAARSEIGDCTEEERIVWNAEDNYELESGFFHIMFRAVKEDLGSEWFRQDVMVKTTCRGMFYSGAEIGQRKCTDVIGNIRLTSRVQQEEIEKLVYLSKVTGTLLLEGTDVSEFHLPHLMEVSSLQLIGNESLKVLNLPLLQKVVFRLDLTGNNSLAGTAGFDSLVEVGGELKLQGGFELVDGFPELKVVGTLNISNNPKLRRISGMPSLKQVFGDLTLMGNGDLERIDSFQNISLIAERLYMMSNTALREVTGFSKLSTVNLVVISAHPHLQTLPNFASLETVGVFVVSSNDSLQSLEGLGSITRVNQLTITQNQALHSLSGLDSLKSTWYLTIAGNPQLSQIDSLGRLEVIEGELDITSSHLTDLSGLEHVSLEEGAILRFSMNPELTSLDGLPRFTTISSVELVDNPKLKDIMALEPMLMPEDGVINISGSNIQVDRCPNPAQSAQLTKFCSALHANSRGP